MIWLEKKLTKATLTQASSQRDLDSAVEVERQNMTLTGLATPWLRDWTPRAVVRHDTADHFPKAVPDDVHGLLPSLQKKNRRKRIGRKAFFAIRTERTPHSAANASNPRRL